jgi:hypothetical protein
MAIDAIRRNHARSDEARPSRAGRQGGWEAMRQNVNIELAYLKFITDVSTLPRHGKRSALPLKKTLMKRSTALEL